jgi:hypothetical protein
MIDCVVFRFLCLFAVYYVLVNFRRMEISGKVHNAVEKKKIKVL